MPEKSLIIIGAGPAGLTAAHRAAERDQKPLVLEGREKVGGIACTENYKGFLFDMGGHRFFSKDPEIHHFWMKVLEKDLLLRSRLSRIYYNGKFFDYPLKPLNALKGIGPWKASCFMGSYLWWHLFPHKTEDTFEQWVTNRFGKSLFNYDICCLIFTFL